MVWNVAKSFEGDDTTFFTVPKSWVERHEGACFVFYPPIGHFKDVTKAIAALKSPQKDVWKDKPADVLPIDFSTFLSAKQTEARSYADELTWDLLYNNGVPLTYGAGRRTKTKKKIRLPGEKSTTEVDSSDDESGEGSEGIPSPPKRPKPTEREPSLEFVKKQLFVQNKPPASKNQKKSEEDQQQSGSKDGTRVSASGVSPEARTPTSPVPSTSRSNDYPKRDSTPKKQRGKPAVASAKSPARGRKASAPRSPRHAPKSPNKSTPNSPRSRTRRTPKKSPFKSSRRSHRSPNKSPVKQRTTETGMQEKDKNDGDEELALAMELMQQDPIEGQESTTNVEKRKPTLEEMVFFLVKKSNSLEKKLDLLIKSKSNLEDQLKFSLPCTKSKRIFEIHDILKRDETQYKTLVSVLAAQPNSKGRDRSVVNHILRYLMNDRVAAKFCYTGSNKKFKFNGLKICDAVTEAARSVKGESTSTEVLAKAIGDWLIQANNRISNRLGGEINKVTKKNKSASKLQRPAVLETSESESENANVPSGE